MNKRITRALMPFVLATVTGLALVGCASTPPGGSSGETVSVDVGTGTPVELPTGALRLGIIFNGQSNEWQKLVATTIKEQAEARGWTATIVDSNFDTATRLNQLQQIATTRSYDAVIVVPIDDTECDSLTTTLPEAGVLVSVLSAPTCGRNAESGDEMWSPGTLNFVGGDTSADYYRAWFDAIAAANPGEQKVAVLIGPELSPFTLVQKQVAEEFASEHPEWGQLDFIYTDYTTPTGYQNTLNYLTANPDLSVLISVYTPDLTRGAVQAIDAAGMTGDVAVADIGASKYTVDQIKAGTVQLSIGFFPLEDAASSLQSIVDAQSGAAPSRFISVIPESAGSIDDPFVVDAETVDSFTPEY
ncbi:sugar ABC transporter substrate-binding protein [Cnuibacter physcomitrellae]|uniref:sugar ABC transporter substrate-binding protein n=1 Tax=Cnuibacter physcomitrellae TaxID=1619308 RepID=UPI0021761D53|nr:sugar ABC transporter substrate-binding protein [Cnuibacter physcomitrellae]MCS5498331.1 sugar ABC transporter substrate-binding protein [Cnuibacter physcomitrellae]